MATITAGDFRNGKTFEMDGKVMQVVEFQHVKPGKGAAFVRTKMRNVVTGAVTETSFNPTAKFEEACVDRRGMAYSYSDGDLYYFMDQETFDMVPLNKELLGDKLLTDMLGAHAAGVLPLMVEPLGGPQGAWNRMLHLLQRPWKAAAREKCEEA